MIFVYILFTMNLEYMMYPMILNWLNNIKDGASFTDYILLLFSFIMYNIYSSKTTEKYINIIFDWFDDFFESNKYNTIQFISEEKDSSLRFKALMYHLSSTKNESIRKIKELSQYRWHDDDNDDWVRSESKNWYQVTQKKSFEFKKEIFGNVYYKQIEKTKHNDNIEYKDKCILQLFSKKYSLQELQDFTESCVKEYRKFLKSKTCNQQLLITVNYDKKEECLDVSSTPWESSIEFSNSHFKDKEKYLKIIDFFLNNKDWFIKHGQPYNLGILLRGGPGSGKTRLIKQLINHTKRHAIDIKLNDTFDFNELQKIIHTENIGREFVIPQDERIIIFEDIDAMGESLHCRDMKKKKKKKLEKNMGEKKPDVMFSELMKSTIESQTKTTNNNLSYFLNILDGLNECSGRIIVMTTNKVEHLDKALIRPGRIDINIEFTNCSLTDICEMSKLYWGDKNTFKENNLKPELDNKYTSAEIINKFRSVQKFDEIKKEFMK